MLLPHSLINGDTMKRTLYIFLVLGIAAIATQTFAQLPTTTLRLMGQTNDSANVFRFSVYLKNTSAAAVLLSGGQFHMNFDKTILNGGTATLLIDTTGLGTLGPKNPTVITTTTPGQFRTAAPTPPGPTGAYTLAPGDSVLVARFRVRNTVPFLAILPGLEWRTVLPNPFVKYGAYINTVNTEIQSAATFFLEQRIIPIELTTFTASVIGRDIQLQWKTATELNSDRFEVERSLKGNAAWQVVGNVKAQGTSTSPKDYTFTDARVSAGKFMYRLKMIDNDGTFKYSAAIEAEIALPKEFGISQNYPNPFNPTTKIEYQLPVDAKVTLELFSMSGEKIADLVNQDLAAGYYNVDLNSASYRLPSAVYIYRIQAKGKAAAESFVSTKKMVLIK